jgi:hypothetical protein
MHTRVEGGKQRGNPAFFERDSAWRQQHKHERTGQHSPFLQLPPLPYRPETATESLGIEGIPQNPLLLLLLLLGGGWALLTDADQNHQHQQHQHQH